MNQTNIEETWKPIPFNSDYEVSSHGNFRNSKTKKQKIFNVEALKSTQTRIRVDIKNDLKNGSGFYLHRVIAMTFIPNPHNLEEVNHIDGNPYNNRVENLEWITREDNMRHFHENRTKYENKNVRQVVLCCGKTDEIINSYKCVEECIVSLGLGISYATLYSALSTTVYEKPVCEKIRGLNKYVGVVFNKINKKYVASYKNKYIGCFDIEEDAANAYDNYLRKLCILPLHVNFPGILESQAIVGKRKYNNNSEKGTYKLPDVDQYLRFAEPETNKIHTEDIEWRQIAEAPNYSVSNTGLVKLTRLNRLLSGYNRNGYLQVSLKKDGEQLHRLVHRLVATEFIPNDDTINRIYVDHIDTDPRNNNVSNLRWVTPKENMNNEITKKNVSDGHIKKSPNVYQVEIESRNVVREAENSIEMAKQTNIKVAIVQKIANYYKKIVKNGFDVTRMSVLPGEQKTYDGKWIFLYENEYNMRIQIIETCTLAQNNVGKSGKNVDQIDKKTGSIIASYSSMYEASKQLNINYTGISQVYNYHKYDNATRPACYKLKSINGFIFKDSE
jgi:hypothetical protein